MTVDTDKVEVKELETKVPEPSKKAQEAATQSLETSKPPEETQEQINWRKFRQERDRERKEKAESDKRLIEKEKETSALKAAMESLLNRPQPSQQLEEIEETEDQRIQKKVDKAFEDRQRAFDVERQKREAAELPQKLASVYNDFNQVCSQENMDYLEYHHPEIWAGFKHSAGNFDVWSGLYKTIKKLVPNTDTRREQAKIEKNLGKPQSMSSPGATQTGDQAPTALTDQRRQDNWKRMREAMRSS